LGFRYLIPEWNKGKPRGNFEWIQTKRYKIRCSPKCVWNRAYTIDINGAPYVLTSTNCHEWATKLANELGIELDKAMEQLLPVSFTNFVDFFHVIANFFNTGAINSGSLSVASTSLSIISQTSQTIKKLKNRSK